MALSYYQKGDFSKSLEILDEILSNAESGLQKEAIDTINSILGYLSFNQRLNILNSNVKVELKRKVVVGYFQRYPREKALELLDALIRSDAANNYSSQRQIARNLQDLAQIPITSVQVPEGTIINIGLLLPSFDFDPEDKEVSRALYNGFLIAVDAFNRQNTTQKIRVHYLNTDRIRDNMIHEIRSFQKKNSISAFIGPLFSEEVIRVESLSKELNIPFIAPLANSFRLNDYDGLIYQVNPSFEERGIITARLAVEKLGLQKFGIMVEKGTHGEIDAQSFANEIENLGGEVVRFINEDFESTGYFVGDHTPWFANNNALVDTTRFVADTLDAVYLPFTGDAASTLMNLTLTGLETFQPDYIVISNEEINYLNHSVERMRRLNMMYSSTFNLNEGSEVAINFRYDYLNRTGLNPNTYAYIGYDIGKYYTDIISRIKNPDDFKLFVAAFEPFQGISTSIYFGNFNSNSLLKLYQLTPNGSILIGNED
jgi:ABC-type branched-subunit amino acid transport system substrate-binding protein